MHSATPETWATPPTSDLLVWLPAMGRALEADFPPRAFLDDLSIALQSLVPHHRLRIGYLADDRRTFSLFAEQAGLDVVPTTDRYTTDSQQLVVPRCWRRTEGPVYTLCALTSHV